MIPSDNARGGWQARQVRESVRLAGWSLASGATWTFAVLGALPSRKE